MKGNLIQTIAAAIMLKQTLRDVKDSLILLLVYVKTRNVSFISLSVNADKYLQFLQEMSQ